MWDHYLVEQPSMMHRRSLLAFLSGSMLGVLGEHQSHAATITMNVYSALKQDDDFSVWKELVDRVGLASLLQGSDPVTLFALTDYALSVGPNLSIPPHGVQMAPELCRRIKLLVEAHIVKGIHDLAEISSAPRVYKNMAGGLVSVSKNGYNITISWESSVSSAEGTVTSAPRRTPNGLIYAIGPLVAQPLKK